MLSGTFDNYILAADAKAAVNTVYGDAVGERGTSIDVEHYYLPNYTATTPSPVGSSRLAGTSAQ